MIDFDSAKAERFVEFVFDGNTHKLRKIRALTPEFIADCGDLSTVKATDLMARIYEADGGDGSIFDKMEVWMSEQLFKEIQGEVSLGE